MAVTSPVSPLSFYFGMNDRFTQFDEYWWEKNGKSFREY
jgi:hypothetical protein